MLAKSYFRELSVWMVSPVLNLTVRPSTVRTVVGGYINDAHRLVCGAQRPAQALAQMVTT
jgi:hypothetical protein